MRILIVNVGSTSLKLRVIGEDDQLLGKADLPPPPGLSRDALEAALARLGPIDAVGHRIVHGGDAFTAAVRLDDEVIGALRALTDLAPLHQPPALDAVDIVAAVLPGVPAVACFDTAFHATLPAAASTYAIPARWRALGGRRYGFHGLSHAWASRRAVELCALPASQARVVTCHLGGGGSLAAVVGGRSVDTTMGFTPLEGLVMTTRSGSLDPGLILWLQQHRDLSADEVADTLEHGCGLLGLCGSVDMREISARVAAGDPSAILAFGVYVHSLRAGIAAMAAAMGGLDALAFTGGIGEGSPEVRASACASLGFLGIALDDSANAVTPSDLTRPDRLISSPESTVSVLVIAAREDLEIAAGVRSVLGAVPGAVVGAVVGAVPGAAVPGAVVGAVVGAVPGAAVPGAAVPGAAVPGAAVPGAGPLPAAP